MLTATDRLEVRLPPEDKALLARAADIEGVEVGQFVLDLALRRAREVVAQAEAALLSTDAANYQRILDTLANPSGPTDALRASMQKYARKEITWR